jgi:tartrate dehydratase beta subunit/fumarate hydratase class I family protein
MSLNTTDPSTDGAAIYLGNKDSVAFAAGSALAAAQWVAWSDLGTQAVVTEVS